MPVPLESFLVTTKNLVCEFFLLSAGKKSRVWLPVISKVWGGGGGGHPADF